MGGRPELPFHIIKDLFEFINLRKDGMINLNEWLQVFKDEKSEQNNENEQNRNKKRNEKNRNNSMMLEAKNANMRLSTAPSDRLVLNQPPKVKVLPQRGTDNARVESCKDYDLVMKIIGIIILLLLLYCYYYYYY